MSPRPAALSDIVIEEVGPETDGGRRHPVKRVVGDPLRSEASTWRGASACLRLDPAVRPGQLPRPLLPGPGA